MKAALVVALLLPPSLAAAVDCTSRPDLCNLPTLSEIHEPNLAVAHDIVFLGEGFTLQQLPEYQRVVADWIAGLKALPAAAGIVANDPSLFNFHRIDVASASDDVVDDDLFDTVFGGYTRASPDWNLGFGMSGDLSSEMRALLAFTAAANAPDVDTVVVVVHVAQSRPWALLPIAHTSGGWAFLASTEPPWVLNHELGHAIFSLADEYAEPGGGCSPWQEEHLLALPNLTADPSGRKFARAGTPTPTSGGRKFERCIWRPADTCAMRTSSDGTPFCPVCARFIGTQLAERRNQDDREAPFVAWIGTPPKGPVAGKVMVEGAAWDTRRLGKIALLVDGRQSAVTRVAASPEGSAIVTDINRVSGFRPLRFSFEWDSSFEEDGRHVLTLTAYDAAGHVDSVSRTVEVTGGRIPHPPMTEVPRAQTDPRLMRPDDALDDGSNDITVRGCTFSPPHPGPSGAGLLSVFVLLSAILGRAGVVPRAQRLLRCRFSCRLACLGRSGVGSRCPSVGTGSPPSRMAVSQR